MGEKETAWNSAKRIMFQNAKEKYANGKYEKKMHGKMVK